MIELPTGDRVQMIKMLRSVTGLGLMETKKALEQNNWDHKAALDYLKRTSVLQMTDSHWSAPEEFTWL